MSHLLYVVGVPGSGKTTLIRELVLGLRRRVVKQPFAHTVYEGGLVQLGRDREGSGGTDALSMSVQPSVLAMLGAGGWGQVLGEGDRLANAPFFDGVAAAGYALDVVLLDLPAELAAERRVARGSDQSETWLKGRLTKVENLRPRATIVLDAQQAPSALAAALADHPAVRRPATVPSLKSTSEEA